MKSIYTLFEINYLQLRNFKEKSPEDSHVKVYGYVQIKFSHTRRNP